jgi:hypothetical protein
MVEYIVEPNIDLNNRIMILLYAFELEMVSLHVRRRMNLKRA